MCGNPLVQVHVVHDSPEIGGGCQMHLAGVTTGIVEADPIG